MKCYYRFLLCFLFSLLFFSKKNNAQNRDLLTNINQLNNESEFESIASPYSGNIAYADDESIAYFDGTSWVFLNKAWKINGNTNLNSGSFIGCNNSADFLMKTNNINRMIIKNDGKVGVNVFSSPVGKFDVKTNTDIDFSVSQNGNVGIGTTNPTQKLHVNGNVLAESFNTPDYVFENYFEGKNDYNPNYCLKKLDQVKAFVRKEKHLPNIPSASDIKKQGGIVINEAVEMNLEKIEELFIYLIELRKKTTDIEKQLVKLEKEKK